MGRSIDTSLRKTWRQVLPLLLLLLLVALGRVIWVLSSPLDTTRVRLDIQVEAVSWDSNDTIQQDPDRFGWNLRGSARSTYSQPPALIASDPTKAKFDEQAPLELLYRSTPDTLGIEKLTFPPLAHLGLTQTGAELRLTASADSSLIGQELQWEVVFRHRDYPRPATSDVIPLDRPATTGPFRLVMHQPLRPGHEYDLTLTNALPWKSPDRVLAHAVHFELLNPSKTSVVSSVLGGTIKMLDVDKSDIELAEHDVVVLKLAHPAELFLSGDGKVINVRLDGEVSSIKCGPAIMGDDNERMPLTIQYISDKRPYVLGWLGSVLVPLLAVVGGVLFEWRLQRVTPEPRQRKKSRKKKKNRSKPPPQVTLPTGSLLLVLLLAAAPAAGQPPAPVPVQRCASILVKLRAVTDNASENGSGFVVGATADSVFVATAAHVLLRPTATIRVWLEGQPPELPARILAFVRDTATGHDLALVGVAVWGYRPTAWPAFCTEPTTSDDIWFVHTEQADSTVSVTHLNRTRLPRAGGGVLSGISRRRHTLMFSLSGVAQGDSGSPLFITVQDEPIVVGMITEKSKPHTAHDMEYIAAVLRPRLGRRWLLPTLPSRPDNDD